MADLASVQSARAFANTEQTSAEQARPWQRYNEYLSNIGLIEDPFFDSLSVGQWHWVLGCFAQALQDGRFSAE